MMRYYFLKPTHGNQVVFLLLSPAVYSQAMPWTASKQEEPYAMVVPYIEAGIKGNIPLDFVDAVIEVNVEPNDDATPSSALWTNCSNIVLLLGTACLVQ
jgi:hypothetical protein